MDSHHRGGLVGPVLLVGLGLIFLGQNLGWVREDIWLSLLRLWPLILVAAGIDLLIPRRSIWGTLLSLVLVVAVFAGGFWLSGVSAGGAREGQIETVSIPLANATRAEIHFNPPVAALELRALSGSQAAVEGTVPRGGYGRVRTESTISGSTAQVEVTATGAYIIPAFGPRDETWRFGLTPAVPLDLEVSMGLGLIEADLTGLDIASLDVELGLGQVVITLPAEGSFSGNVSGAIGQMIVVIPEGSAVRIRMTTAIGGMRTPDGGRSIDVGDKEYTSPNYETAQDRIDLQIEQAIGAIIIREG
jgi:hypothetical protein